MPEKSDPHTQAIPAGGDHVRAALCAVFLVDESAAMDARVASGTKSKIDCIATALNSLLNQLTAGPSVQVSIVGYRSGSDGQPDIGARWAGPLAGSEFVTTGDLAAAPLTVEDRVRKVPGPDAVGVAREEKVSFPVWYAPTLGGSTSVKAAFEHCRGLLRRWSPSTDTTAKAPLIVSLVGELPEGESLEEAVGAIRELDTPGGQPTVLHAHLGSSARIPPTLYPSSDMHIPPGPIRDLFRFASALPPPLAEAIRCCRVTVNPGARGLIYNARMVDLIRFLSLVKVYAQDAPEVSAKASPS